MGKMKQISEDCMSYLNSTKGTPGSKKPLKRYCRSENIIIARGFGYPELQVEYKRMKKK